MTTLKISLLNQPIETSQRLGFVTIAISDFENLSWRRCTFLQLMEKMQCSGLCFAVFEESQQSNMTHSLCRCAHKYITFAGTMKIHFM
jgi:hypothetical protein